MAVHKAEVQPEHALSATVHAARQARIAKVDHLLGEATLLQQLQCPRLDADGARGGSRLPPLVNEPNRDVEAGQAQCDSQAGRPGAHDKDWVGHGSLSSKTI